MRSIVLFLLLAAFSVVRSQDRFTIIEEKLNQLAKDYPGVNETVELSTNGASIQDYIKAIATTNHINVTIDPSIDIKLSNSFSKVTAKDVFIFLCKRYDLDILFVGPIITFIKHSPPPPPAPTKPLSVKPKIIYHATANLLSYDLNKDTLSVVSKEITKQSGKNIIFSPDVGEKLVSGFMQNAPFESALEKLAFANEMKVTRTRDDFFVFQKVNPVETTGQTNETGNGQLSLVSNDPEATNKFSIRDGLISMDVQGAALGDVVSAVSKELGREYFLFSDLKGKATLKVTDAPYDDFLSLLFNGTEITYKKVGATYMIGDRNLEGLRHSTLITLKNRTIEKIADYIPAELKKGIEIKVFEDLNGIIVSGSQPKITELEAFIRKLDLVVPMVHIEVIIADVRKSNSLSAGIRAGIGTSPAIQSNPTIVPDYNITLNANAINTLLSGINGFGVINLGAVTPNFYLHLKAMESNGILKLRSTPQLATLNGHEAKLSIGQTQYYQEVNNNLVNSAVAQQNLLQTVNWRPVNADLSLTIDPQVSGDEQITMTINVKQSSFTERVKETAPPGTINRDFQSLIRVKNGEMIMLGGLEENESNNTGSGLPFLSRVPVLRWIFGERTKSKRESKLTIFIKPTIIYG